MLRYVYSNSPCSTVIILGETCESIVSSYIILDEHSLNGEVEQERSTDVPTSSHIQFICFEKRQMFPTI